MIIFKHVRGWSGQNYTNQACLVAALMRTGCSSDIKNEFRNKVKNLSYLDLVKFNDTASIEEINSVCEQVGAPFRFVTGN